MEEGYTDYGEVNSRYSPGTAQVVDGWIEDSWELESYRERGRGVFVSAPLRSRTIADETQVHRYQGESV